MNNDYIVRFAGCGNWIPTDNPANLVGESFCRIGRLPKWLEINDGAGGSVRFDVELVDVEFGHQADYAYEATLVGVRIMDTPFPYTYGRVYKRGVLIGYVADYRRGFLIDPESRLGQQIAQLY